MDVIKGTAASLGLFLAYVLVLLGGPISAMMSPFPVMYYSLKSGRWVGVAIVVLASAGVAFLSATAAVLYLLQCGVFALLLTEFVRRGVGASKAIAFTLAINMAFYAVIFLGYGAIHGVDVNAVVVKGITSAISQSEIFYSRSGISGEDLETLRLGLKQTGRFISNTYPALSIVLLGAIAGFNLLLLQKAAARFSKRYFFGDFRKFRNPDYLVWILIASGFAMIPEAPVISKVALNVLILAGALYFLQGLAVVITLSHRLGVPRFLRFIFYVILAIQPYLAAVVAGVGLFDLWCEFRTPKKTVNL